MSNANLALAPSPSASSPPLPPFQLLINGSLTAGVEHFSVLNPATEEEISLAPACTRAQLDSAVDAAATSYVEWSRAAHAERSVAMRAFADRIEEHAETLALVITQEQGKPLTGAHNELKACVAWCRAYADMELPQSERVDAYGKRWITRHVPLGVVAAIAPWNFPLSTAIFKIAPALMAGNTVVVKPSPFTPLSMLKLGELTADVFPPGVFNVVTGSDELGPWLTTHPKVAKISFTGSTATGRKVMASAADTLKRITLELGGNDPAIVLPDVDVPKVAKRLFFGAFSNSGQVCIAAKRIYVHDSIYEAFAKAFSALARDARIGRGDDPATAFGPIQNRPQFERVKAIIADTRASGARFLAGGDVAQGTGYFVPLTVVDNPPDTSRVVMEEPFGPVVPLLRYSDLDDVVQRANSTEFGLGASVWSSDPQRALEVAQRLEAGTVWINTILTLDPLSAFSGHKQSGIGTENGIEGMLAYTVTQTFVV